MTLFSIHSAPPERRGLASGHMPGARRPLDAPNRSAFTLMEVVLAVALMAVVVYLLTTAIELYLFGVETNRTRVESAQLARTLLDQIADDIVATRLHDPAGAAAGGQFGGPQSGGASAGPGGAAPNANGPPGSGYGGGPPSGGGPPGSSGPPGGGPPTGGASGQSTVPADLQGLFGNVEVIRLDRGARPNWERATRIVDLQETTAAADMPASVRYYFVGRQHLSTERAAAQGVSADPPSPTTTGLYRETIATAAIAPQADPTASAIKTPPGARLELLSPEVVAFELAYWDGKQLRDDWDSTLAGGLPVGVEIRLTLAEPQFQSTPDPDEQRRHDEGRFDQNELVEYRRFVYLPRVEPGPPAQPLLSASENNAQQGGGPNQNNRSGPGGANGGGPNNQRGNNQ